MSRDDDCDSLDGLIEDLMVGEETVDSCGVNSNIDTCQAKRERSSSDDILDAAIEEIAVGERMCIEIILLLLIFFLLLLLC